MSEKGTGAVLVAHRDDRLAEEITDILRGGGWSVGLASDGLDAAAKIVARPFDVILVDLFLPKLDGVGILQRVRALGRSTPVVIVGRAMGKARQALEKAEAMGGCVRTASKDPTQLVRILMEAFLAPPPGGQEDKAPPPPGETPKDTPAPLPPAVAAGPRRPRARGGADRRRHMRVPIQTVVHYKSPDSMDSASASDVSEGGMFVESSNPPSVGTPLTLKFALPGHSRPFLLPGKVVRIEKPPAVVSRRGMGVRFASIDRAIQGAIGDFVNAALAGRGAWGVDSVAVAPDAPPPEPEGELDGEVPEAAGAAPPAAGDLPPSRAIRLRIEFRTHEAFLAEYEANISHDGLFIPTAEPLDRGARLAVEIHLPNCTEVISVDGEVVCRIPADPARKAPAGVAVHLATGPNSRTHLLHRFASLYRGARLS